jgi:hypothetical protein
MAIYSVVPFVAKVGPNEGAAQAADQLDKLVKGWTDAGWEYVRLERVDTFIAGTDGCFGLGATPGRFASYSMAVFKR